MEKAPEEWVGDTSFQAAKKNVSALVLVNDRAKRAVKLIEDHNVILTKDKSQKQALVHVVTEHRKRFTNANKSTVAVPSTST